MNDADFSVGSCRKPAAQRAGHPYAAAPRAEGAFAPSAAPEAWLAVLAASERVDWKLDEVLSENESFDFARPFLPDVLVGAGELEFLLPGERLALNHVRAHGYLGVFGVVEELILPFVLAHASPERHVELAPVRALLRFASEEAKHVELFRRFSRVFVRGFGRECALVGPPEALARAVLAHSELGVALAILHIEWMTQQHWLECARGDGALEPAFKRLLRHHWMEEAQHARLDALLVRELAQRASDGERERAVDDYLAIVGIFDGALRAQVELDLATLDAVLGRALSASERRAFVQTQIAAQRRTFLLSGMRHARFRDVAGEVLPGALERIDAHARALETIDRRA